MGANYSYTTKDIHEAYAAKGWDGETVDAVMGAITDTVVNGNLALSNDELITSINSRLCKTIRVDEDSLTDLTMVALTRLSPISHVVSDETRKVSSNEGVVNVRLS